MLEWLPAAAFVALTVLCVVSAAIAVVAARASWPFAQQRVVQDLSERVLAAEAIVSGLTAKWAAKVAELEGVCQEVEGALEAVERKRRRIAASESKAEAREQQQQLATDPDARRQQLKALARARGIAV